MRRNLTALAICAGVILASTSHVPTPAQAETLSPLHWKPGSAVTLFDRTNDARATEAIHYAIGIWNGLGANLTLVYKRGPADNQCFGEKAPPDFVTVPNSVGICLYPSGSNGDFSRFPAYPLDGSNHLIEGFAGQCTEAPCAGLSEAKRIIPHEIGHVLGLAHTAVDSMGACSIMSVECYSLVPNQNDRDSLRKHYAHTHGVVVAGNAWFSDGTALRLASANVATTVRVYGTNTVSGVPYRLVTGKGTAQAPCSTEIVVANTAVVTPGPSGLLGTVTGNVTRPAGDWQVCFLATDASTATAPVTYRAA